MTRPAAAEPFDRRAEAAHIADARGLGVPFVGSQRGCPA